MADPSGGAHGVDLVEAFGRLQTLTLEAPRVEEFLAGLAVLAPRLADEPVSCSVTVRGDAAPFTAASRDAFAQQLDDVQYDRDEGPCLEALSTARDVYVPDLRADTRWPSYRPRAVAAGVRSSASFPMRVDGTAVGVLNLYATRLAAFDDAVRQRLAVFAAHSAGGLAMVLRQVRRDELGAQLEQALASRTTIDQALGILMAQQRCTADQAFALLRTHSQNSNRKVRDVAAEIIERVSGAAPRPGAPFTA